MAHLTLGERARVLSLAADRAWRLARTDIAASRLLRWHYGAPSASELLFVPQDLRAADPSFASEIEFGHFGLAGAVAFIERQSPFDIVPPSEAWSRELAGFGWLRHLRAAGHAKARAMAIGLVASWIDRPRQRRSIGWQPDVVGRRIMSWLGSSTFLLDEGDVRAYDLVTDSLGDQLIHLSATWPAAAPGYPRLLALIGLTMADLCIAGHQRNLAVAERQLAAELDAQVLADGGHVSRNPAVLIELLLDLLPLRQCFAARQRDVPPALDAATNRIFPMLRYLRMGNGALARFNGVASQAVDLVATVIAYDPKPSDAIEQAPQSHYVRLERGTTVAVVDAGPPPPLHLAGSAHAGCLSFELTVGGLPLIVNGGAPGPSNQDWNASARSTASHNTLSLASRSSARLVDDPLLAKIAGGLPIRFPDGVAAEVKEKGGAITLEAHHDGYLRRFKLLHRRHLTLAADGGRLDGVDRLGPTRGQLRLPRDVPYAVHFHLHPDVGCRLDGSRALLTLGDGARWKLSAGGAALAIEESIHFADLAGPRQSLQLVIRGACGGESEIRWTLERIAR